ncbi:hypothetical protein TGAM01_v205203, partial [Trichoderma gamsii]
FELFLLFLAVLCGSTRPPSWKVPLLRGGRQPLIQRRRGHVPVTCSMEGLKCLEAPRLRAASAFYSPRATFRPLRCQRSKRRAPRIQAASILTYMLAGNIKTTGKSYDQTIWACQRVQAHPAFSSGPFQHHKYGTELL